MHAIALVFVALAIGVSVAIAGLVAGDIAIVAAAPIAASAAMLACGVAIAHRRGWSSPASADLVDSDGNLDALHDALTARLRAAASELARADAPVAARAAVSEPVQDAVRRRA